MRRKKQGRETLLSLGRQVFYGSRKKPTAEDGCTRPKCALRRCDVFTSNDGQHWIFACWCTACGVSSRVQDLISRRCQTQAL
ncbi:hypothetical protein DPMN_051412 [Dreissena polymorpha]|uniref:Uncharacterized protein n=1 Tax=Dreissena polymorpha TaxID=45954 RepID=A0A9D4CII5_DREPO|nr:hypothetical protein DPMN_051412 [Dreissena polymorpha]